MLLGARFTVCLGGALPFVPHSARRHSFEAVNRAYDFVEILPRPNSIPNPFVMQYNKFNEKRNGSQKAVGRQPPINRVQKRPDPGKAILISAVCLIIAAFQYCYLRYAYPNDTPTDGFADVQSVTEWKDDPVFSWHNVNWPLVSTRDHI